MSSKIFCVCELVLFDVDFEIDFKALVFRIPNLFVQFTCLSHVTRRSTQVQNVSEFGRYPNRIHMLRFFSMKSDTPNFGFRRGGYAL